MNAQRSTATTEKKYEGFTDEERAAMKEPRKVEITHTGRDHPYGWRSPHHLREHRRAG